RWEPFIASNETAASFPPRKTAQVEGPAEHAFMSRFVLVPVLESAERVSRMEIEVINAAKEFQDQWKTRYAAPCRLKSQSEINSQDIADSNLIFYMPAKPRL